ncbi:hypothetical protein HTZ97_14225 [Desulfuromonas acetoxidans]|uniref:OmpA-like domain-containing protein n=1 Tax=Desulfuromonas acetoxidans (strain DSM 684 / 11070) TaxID=281689 RepID=Q1JWA9_DESA6|nr:hypothetical protein [Desulfuromonas acetoxidans]EAT14512.1 hypothetical protein Dace_0373 [Desulfuromonas acetoxidans DSM 684]MBF0645272.1 hypothetical protein [Desulfuromonas acetoxidans]NVD25578.1 hypothetical protein [Desulfuromonas acetoxidans]NVE17612.1 hypothetical protein [Desulfuromonas acetoxidans]
MQIYVKSCQTLLNYVLLLRYLLHIMKSQRYDFYSATTMERVLKKNSMATQWKIRRKGFLIAVVLLGLAGCQPFVGGHCCYERQIGTAVVQNTTEEGACAIFSAARPWSELSQAWQGRCLPFTNRNIAPSQRRYPARLSVITEGSCVPVRLQVLSDERMMQGVSLDLDEEGRESEAARQSVLQIVATFNALTRDWPQSCLLISGQGSDKYSAEYRWNLARRYEQKFREKFIDLGLEPQRVNVLSGALPDNRWPAMQDSAHGVQVFFQLQPSLLPAKDTQ